MKESDLRGKGEGHRGGSDIRTGVESGSAE